MPAMSDVLRRAQRRRSIEANLFPYAHAAVEPWDTYRWHSAAGEVCDAFKEKSSQALSIDVFGTLKLHPHRDQVFGALAAELGLPPAGPWEVALEWHDPDNLLGEKTPTFVDALARSPQAVILFECKFTEPDGGACGQTLPIARGKHHGLRQCTGHYRPQVNPTTGRAASCALSAKGFRYWDYIPAVFGYRADLDYVPCPFSGPWNQWMRNLTTCAAVGQRAGLRPAFVVVYADEPRLPMATRVRQPEWKFLESIVNPAAAIFKALSYQHLLALAQRANPADPVWPDLAFWVNRKIAGVCGMPSYDEP
jgi:hypothetical protein